MMRLPELKTRELQTLMLLILEMVQNKVEQTGVQQGELTAVSWKKLRMHYRLILGGGDLFEVWTSTTRDGFCFGFSGLEHESETHLTVIFDFVKKEIRYHVTHDNEHSLKSREPFGRVLIRIRQFLKGLQIVSYSKSRECLTIAREFWMPLASSPNDKQPHTIGKADISVQLEKGLESFEIVPLGLLLDGKHLPFGLTEESLVIVVSKTRMIRLRRSDLDTLMRYFPNILGITAFATYVSMLEKKSPDVKRFFTERKQRVKRASREIDVEALKERFSKRY
jgi:hypothetical protein